MLNRGSSSVMRLSVADIGHVAVSSPSVALGWIILRCWAAASSEGSRMEMVPALQLRPFAPSHGSPPPTTRFKARACAREEVKHPSKSQWHIMPHVHAYYCNLEWSPPERAASQPATQAHAGIISQWAKLFSLLMSFLLFFFSRSSAGA